MSINTDESEPRVTVAENVTLVLRPGMASTPPQPIMPSLTDAPAPRPRSALSRLLATIARAFRA